jgi:LysM repeat protein
MVSNPPSLWQWRNFRLTPLELLVLVLALLGIIFLISMWVQPSPVSNPSFNIDSAMNEHLMAQETQTNEALNSLRQQQEDLRKRVDSLERQLQQAAIREPTAPESRPQVHIVKAGDTLQALADKYKISLNNLMRWNKLASGARLRVGQELLLTPQ